MMQRSFQSPAGGARKLEETAFWLAPLRKWIATCAP
jgi:hypothetical protein